MLVISVGIELREREDGEQEAHKKFHKVWRKTEKDAEVSGTAMPNDLQLMAIWFGDGSHHSREQSSRSWIGIIIYYIRRVHAEAIRAYSTGVNSIPFDDALVRASMSADTSISTSTVAIARTSEMLTRDSSTPPSFHALGPTSPLPNPTDGVPPSSRDAT
ncbi:hypothetical protein M9H77_33695 [Catharanthus roseus]|uniref:Uncharacterized protein n=1 Tax=Catharanthus roseus TaxID=4058 RepID=A0ACB9ZJE2_CATRO|nr:hypothetical protein M9H77_33695 [Catharanthus roseus]